MNILFRCDANSNIGTGHAMRCLALAQELKDAGDGIAFVFNSLSLGIKKRLKNEKFDLLRISKNMGSVLDAKATIKLAKHYGANWIITDGYYFKTHYQKRIKEAGFRLMCIDDIAKCKYISDLVLNQNPGFSAKSYSIVKHTKLLLGPKFALLRREFSNSFIDNKIENNKILVTFGGSDKNNLTGKVLGILEKIYAKGVVVLLGSSNPNIKQINERLRRSRLSVKIVVDAENVVDYMLEAKVAIHAAGTTSWELAYLGIPSICFILAENQEPIAKELEKSGFSYNMGWYNKFSERKLQLTLGRMLGDLQLLKRMARKGQSLIDGKGTKRARKEIVQWPL